MFSLLLSMTVSAKPPVERTNGKVPYFNCITALNHKAQNDLEQEHILRQSLNVIMLHHIQFLLRYFPDTLVQAS